jgi:hypothetical protein
VASTLRTNRYPPLLYALALFASAALLFVVEPLAGRLVLPKLGGTPAVWVTCLLYFQVMLLAGYLYAHAAPTCLGERRHAALHLAVLLIPWLVLPVALPSWWPAPDAAPPVPWLLGLLLVSVGLPFFAVATTGPLLQRWFAATGHPAGRDPYFLYAASNVGSMVGLFSYPFVLEPLLSLGDQGRLWAVLYGAFVILVAACAAAFWRSPRPAERASSEAATLPVPPPGWGRRLRWLVLAFVPSSLLLSVTLHLSTDVVAIPLLWVVPLALYLLSFVVAFARRPLVRAATVARWLPLIVVLVVLTLLAEATEPAALLVPLHLLLLFAVAVFCHCELAENRPPAGRLTEFYLWLSVGGALGGVFNVVVAPLLFRGVTEYPLVLVLACALRPPVVRPAGAGWEPAVMQEEALSAMRRLRWTDVALPVGLGAATVGLILVVQLVMQRRQLLPGPITTGVMFALPVLVCYTFLARPLRFALGVAAVFVAAGVCGDVYGTTQFRARSFFGAHRVTVDRDHRFRVLIHGNTIHGQQFLDPARRHEPLAYYHRTGPIGRVFEMLDKDWRFRRSGRVAVVGLGAGALCCYARKGQRWTFYEIDPIVRDIAQDPELFTYWNDCAVRPGLEMGDARLRLEQSSKHYDLLVVDAFGSDAIPAHLLTREALAVYRAHLAPGGVLAFHISNRYLDLEKVLGDLAAGAGLPCRARADLGVTPDEERETGKRTSHWVVLAEQERTLARFVAWSRVRGQPGRRVWTDDYYSLLGVFKWDWESD